MNDFEITVVSNGTMDIYPDNTLASFVNLLPERLSLQGHWKVALSDIIYPALYYNVSETVIKKVFGFPGSRSIFSRVEEVTFPAGIYHDYIDIIKQLAVVTGLDITGASNLEKILYLTITQPEDLAESEELVSLEFSKTDILSILGFQGSRITIDSGSEISKAYFPVDITGGRSLMFVYTNIIEHQIVGGGRSNLLRLIPLQNRLRNCKLTETVTINREEPRALTYKKLITSSFDRIQIELRDEAGRLLPFMGIGRTAVTLKFEKVSD